MLHTGLLNPLPALPPPIGSNRPSPLPSTLQSSMASVCTAGMLFTFPSIELPGRATSHQETPLPPPLPLPAGLVKPPLPNVCRGTALNCASLEGSPTEVMPWFRASLLFTYTRAAQAQEVGKFHTNPARATNSSKAPTGEWV